VLALASELLALVLELLALVWALLALALALALAWVYIPRNYGPHLSQKFQNGF
jgi:hypothetical protein